MLSKTTIHYKGIDLPLSWLDSLTVKDLKEVAAYKNLTNLSNMSRLELIDYIITGKRTQITDDPFLSKSQVEKAYGVLALIDKGYKVDFEKSLSLSGKSITMRVKWSGFDPKGKRFEKSTMIFSVKNTGDNANKKFVETYKAFLKKVQSLAEESVA